MTLKEKIEKMALTPTTPDYWPHNGHEQDAFKLGALAMAREILKEWKKLPSIQHGSVTQLEIEGKLDAWAKEVFDESR